MRWYNEIVIKTSQSGWMYINTIIIFAGSLYFVFFNLNIPFEAIVGAQMFDFQNDLTTEQIFTQLQHYDDSARAIYHAFLFVDFYFPFFAGLFLASTAAFSLRYLSPGRYEQLRARNLFAVFLIPTLFDWGENTFALTVVSAWPESLNWAATGLVLCKQGKLTGVMFLNGIVGLLLVLALLKWLGTKAGLLK
jgi:hypothetical protein